MARSRTRMIETPEWRTCKALSASSEPQEMREESWTHARSVTWAHFPYRYKLTEFSRQRSVAGFIHTRLQPVMYELSRLSAERTDTGQVDLSRFYIIKSGLLAVFHHQVEHWDRVSEADIEEYTATTQFMIEHGFHAPNAEDQVEVGYALRLAELDGVAPTDTEV